jgi:hypothetical protein
MADAVSKCTPEELQQMAIATLLAWESADQRAFQLVMTLSFVMDMSPEECIERITELANCPEGDIRSAA